MEKALERKRAQFSNKIKMPISWYLPNQEDHGPTCSAHGWTLGQSHCEAWASSGPCVGCHQVSRCHWIHNRRKKSTSLGVLESTCQLCKSNISFWSYVSRKHGKASWVCEKPWKEWTQRRFIFQKLGKVGQDAQPLFLFYFVYIYFAC